jgi:predicted acylesterase/phospholipase RssA
MPPNSHPKTALVLAGGGLTGAVYEIGALRAIDDVLVDRTVNDFDIYVGTSAGSLVAAMLANGISPEMMLKGIAGKHDTVPTIERDDLFHFDARDIMRWLKRMPGKIAGAWSHYLRHYGDMTLFDLVWSLSEALPSGLYDNSALEDYVRRVIREQGRSNYFDQLERDLFIIATDLDSSERAVFGRYSEERVQISRAVAASTAIPLIYKPVRIGQHDYVDGGIRGNASLDIAVEHGATLIVCINPLVPFDNRERTAIPFLGRDGGYLSEKGLSAIANQVGRIQTHAGLHYHIKQLRKTHPEVDIILIEPSRDDYQMFFYNIMRYSARLIVARHGFETVTLRLAENFEYFKNLLGRQGIPISERLVLEELEEIRRSAYDPKVIRRVLEARSHAFRRSYSARRAHPVGQLRNALAELERTLNGLEAPAASPATNGHGHKGR